MAADQSTPGRRRAIHDPAVLAAAARIIRAALARQRAAELCEQPCTERDRGAAA
jgi:hypothetical protein